ncbi:MAG: BBE domain-containing protein [Acidimicrobiales bacterium]
MARSVGFPPGSLPASGGSGRVFQNFADPDLEEWAEAYYGTTYDRLVRIKARYDPENLFRFPQALPTR